MLRTPDGPVRRVRTQARVIVLYSLPQQIRLAALSIQAFKWVLANLTPMVTLRWTGIPFRREWGLWGTPMPWKGYGNQE